MAIKCTPEDFVVEELLAPAVQAQIAQTSAPFVLFRLTKTSLSTPEAAAAVGRALHLPKGILAYAGLKDKHAQSVQHITLKDGQWAGGAAPESAEGPGWKLERLGWLPAPLASQAIAGNRFRIRVRGLSAEDCRAMDEAARLLRVPGPGAPADAQAGCALRFVNYFGAQRFGSARHGQGFLARHLVRGEFEQALRLAIATPARKDPLRTKQFRRAIAAKWGKWTELARELPRHPDRAAIEALARRPSDFRSAFCTLPYFFQQLCVYAYQSHIWNQVARRMVAEVCAARGPVLRADDVFGEMLFPTAAAIPAEWTALEVPLPSRQATLDGPWGPALQAILKEEGLELSQLRIPRVRRPFFGGETRPLCVEASRFAATAPVAEAGPADAGAKAGARARRFSRTLSFELPRGAYATVLLRALGQ